MIQWKKGGTLVLLAGTLLAGAVGCQQTPAQRLEQEIGHLRSARQRGGLTEEEFQQAKSIAINRYAKDEGMRMPLSPAAQKPAIVETTSADVKETTDH